MIAAASNGDLTWSQVFRYMESHVVQVDPHVVMTNYASSPKGLLERWNNQKKVDDSSQPSPRLTNGIVKKKPTKSKQTRESKDSQDDSVDEYVDHYYFNDAPFPPFSRPTKELRTELQTPVISNNNNNNKSWLLRQCIRTMVPLQIVAAILQLDPDCLCRVDTSSPYQLLPLHMACRLPVNDYSTQLLELLVQLDPSTLLVGDVYGRTPLHYLCWYHASHRTPRHVQLFCTKLSQTTITTSLLESHSKRNTQRVWSPQTTTSTSSTSTSSSLLFDIHQYPLPETPKPNAKIPNCAAFVHDSCYGCLPLHYAVMEGASYQVLQVLLQAYPASKHVADRLGRTPAHWYLGAGYLTLLPNNKNNQQQQPTHTTDLPLYHVSGEDGNPHARPWYEQTLDTNIVQLLLSSRVARTTCHLGRTPLHWAANFWAHQYYHCHDSEPQTAITIKDTIGLPVSAVKTILDHHIGQLTMKDTTGQTPLLVLLDTTLQLQQRRPCPTALRVPLSTISLLLSGMVSGTATTTAPVSETNPPSRTETGAATDSDMATDSHSTTTTTTVTTTSASRKVASIEDSRGRLPLHVALEVAAPCSIVQCLVEAHPASLLHTTCDDTTNTNSNDDEEEEEECPIQRLPLHCAFCRPDMAPFISQATIRVLLQSYTVSRKFHVDGRLALKMEDATSGFYPLHWAAKHNAQLSVLQAMVEAYPQAALLQHEGNLPLHYLICSKDRPDGPTLLEVALCTDKKRYTDFDWGDIREKMLVLLRPLLSSSSRLGRRNQDDASHKALKAMGSRSLGGMLPLHIAVLFAAASYHTLLRLLEAYPEAALRFTNYEPSYSCLDLHDIAKTKLYQNQVEEWKRVRELLFSFAPTLESHRHRQELLDRCVQIVVDEVREVGSYHLDQAWTECGEQDLVLSHTLSGMDAPKMINDLKQHSRSTACDDQGSMSTATTSPSKQRGTYPQDILSTTARKTSALLFGTVSSGENLETFDDSTGSKSKSKTSTRYDDDDMGLDYAISDTEYDDDESESYFSEVHDDEGAYSSDSCSDENVEVAYDEDEQTIKTGTFSSVGMEPTFSSDGALLTQTQTTSTNGTLDHIFLEAKRKAEEEEKKDDGVRSRARPSLSRDSMLDVKPTASGAVASVPSGSTSKHDSKLSFAPRPAWFSEVGLRLWAFFSFYRDSRNPNDNYSKQVRDIFDLIEFCLVQKLVSLPVPACAAAYFPNSARKHLKRLTFKETANPKCRELIHRNYYFLGRFDFDIGQDVLSYRSADGTSLILKAHEWVYVTEEDTEAGLSPGVSEAGIWSSGEVPAEVGLTFKSFRRPVRLHLTKRRDIYENEISSRVLADLPVENAFESVDGILPLSYHFNANNLVSKEDRTYQKEIEDERFRTIKVLNGNCAELDNEVPISDYPYAVVYPDIWSDSLRDIYGRSGLNQDGIRSVCKDTGSALQRLHKKGMCHLMLCIS